MSSPAPNPKPYQYVCVLGCVIFVQNIDEMEKHEFNHANNLRSMEIYAEHLIDDYKHHHQLLVRIKARRKLIKVNSPDFIDQFRYPVNLAELAESEQSGSTGSNNSQISLEA